MRERLIGAAVLVIIAVILIPWLVSRAHHPEDVVTRTAWPASATAPAQPYVLPLQSTASAASSVAAMPPPAARTTAKGTPSVAKSVAADSAPLPQPVASRKSVTVNPKPALPSADSTVSPTATPQPARTGWSVQAASFSDIKAARTLEKHLEQAGFKVRLASHRVSKTVYYRVLVGPYPSESRAQSAAPGVARISRTRVLIRKPGSGEE